MGSTLCLIGEGAADAAGALAPDLGGTVRDLGGAADIETPLPYAELVAWRAEATVPTGLDACPVPPGPRTKRLLLADMDSTVIGQECLDELADAAGHGAAVAAVTERAMRGELDFEAALEDRVATLAGLPESVIEDVLRTRIALTPGARVLTATMRARGAACVLVSGGFTRFTGPVARRAGFGAHHGNVLEIRDGVLTGRVVPPILGRAAKAERLAAELSARALGPDDAICVGDGANDLDMLRAVPLGVAFRAKPVTAAAAPVRIDHGDLTALLHLQGFPQEDWADPSA